MKLNKQLIEVINILTTLVEEAEFTTIGDSVYVSVISEDADYVEEKLQEKFPGARMVDEFNNVTKILIEL